MIIADRIKEVQDTNLFQYLLMSKFF